MRMQMPLDYWYHRFGKFINPDADSPISALMSVYPHSDMNRSVQTRLGGSEPARFLISDEYARAWAPIAVPAAAEGAIEIQPTSSRKRRDWMVDIINRPPAPPFLVASVGMSGNDAEHWRLTIDKDLIVFGGAVQLLGEPVVAVNRKQFLDAVEWYQKTKIPVSDLLILQDINRLFKRGLINGIQAKARLKRLKSERYELEQYPGQKHDAVMKLAFFGATIWQLENANA